MSDRERDREREWLETDGLGGFASGTVSGLRTRRYHGLLITATTPPVGRMVLVSGFDAAVETAGGRWMLSTQRYAPDVVGGDGEQHIESFALAPWPTWVFRLPDGTRIAHEVLMRNGAPQVFVSWRLLTTSPSLSPSLAPRPAGARLRVRPFLAGRDFHALMHENPAFSFDPEIYGDRFRYRPYAAGPAIVVSTSGGYRHQPCWYRRFVYEEERRRGLDFEEDLGSPGEWSFELAGGEAAMVFSCEQDVDDPVTVPALDAVDAARAFEGARRAALGGALERAADQYLVARRGGRTIIAGYPWFGDWGRDTFIALRGLLLATGRVTQALEVLAAWAGLVSEGMLPNYFPEHPAGTLGGFPPPPATDSARQSRAASTHPAGTLGGFPPPPATDSARQSRAASTRGATEPEYNSVDASLWYAVAVAEALEAGGAGVSAAPRRQLTDAVEAILDGYARGTRFGIRADGDGLLRAGVQGQPPAQPTQLTWMDARVDGRVITPRIGKPVEVQALWLNALAAAAAFGTPSAGRWAELLARGRASFEARFWNEARGFLHDVVDAGHQPGAVDSTLRPNQIFAVGGLPLALLSGDRARRVVDAVERALVTPLGLRSLAPGEPGYRARYAGGLVARDEAYHQGTVWPWLMGAFVEAFVRARGGGDDVKRAARDRFLAPLVGHLDQAGLGHVSEIADGDAPHAPRGCPFQAWSLAEMIRVERVVLASGAQAPDAAPPAPPAVRR